MITCITLNPSLDTEIFTENLSGRDAKATNVTYRIAGKALNAANALFSAGETCRSIIFLGSTGDFASLPAPHQGIPHSRAMRQNFTFFEGDRLVSHVRSSFQSNMSELRPVFDWIGQNAGTDHLLVLAGSLPELSPEDRAKLIDNMKAFASQLILDVSSLTLRELEDIRPHTIKLNYPEFCRLIDVSEGVEVVKAHLEMVHSTTKAAIIVTQGRGDVLAIGSDSKFLKFSIAAEFASDSPSKIGSGDAFLAGYTSAVNAGASFSDSVRKGIIFGVARQRARRHEPIDYSDDALIDLVNAPVARSESGR